MGPEAPGDLDRMVDHFVARLRQGEHPSVEDYARRHPDLADEIRELFPLLRRLGAETNLVGMELVELNPLVDPTYVTPLVANRCAREILTGIAMRKAGLTEPHYLAPEAVDHGQG